jgi:hypothetical protein
MTLRPRLVTIHRQTEYGELIARHGTRQQAAFFLETRSRNLDEVHGRHEAQRLAMRTVASAMPAEWRRADVERGDLDRFVFGPEDIVVVVGQDGLVANVAKYLDGQPVIGINPEPNRNPGVLVRYPPDAARGLLAAAAQPQPVVEERTMVEASADDGQTLRALNEIYLGHASHQSARYQLRLPDGASEHQSSSGVLAGTGTGATGWLRSAWQERRSALPLPSPTESRLCWFVREAWPSPATGTDLTEGTLDHGGGLTVVAESDQLVCFGDGIESDALKLSWGQRVTIKTAAERLRLVRA